MKIEERLFIEFNDVFNEFENITKLKFHHLGIWNSPKENHLVIDWSDITGYYNYYRGDEKIILEIHTYNDYLGEELDKKWKLTDYGNDIQKFLEVFGKSIYDKYPKSINGIGLSFFDIVKCLTFRKVIPEDKEIIFKYSW